ncbi:MATE efflux family protein [Nitzschia inconspicua]|uniref:MATE efflux family protein n=1 Tax=Nitzschia inconspicua TaxID=303405 RepID=A0A9K3PQ35_9STRA|nr:MATE efflux family protein [Nitzschia inconspicua]
MKPIPSIPTTAIVTLGILHLYSQSVDGFQSASTSILQHKLPSTIKFKARTFVAPIELSDQETGNFNTTVTATATTTSDCESTTSIVTRDLQATAIYPPAPTLQECLSFALPALGIYACPPLMSLIDAAFIGRSSSLELAALGPATSISDSSPLPMLFVSIASTNLIAKAFSRNDTEGLARVTRTALGLGIIGGIVLALALYCSAFPLSILYCGEKAATLASAASTSQQFLTPLCTKYVSIRALALPAVVVTTIAQAICIGTKDTKTPMISVALAALLNLFGDFVLVTGLGQGIAGAAWATAVSQVVAAGLLLRVLKKRGFLQRQQEDTTKIDAVPSFASKFRIRSTTAHTIRQIFTFIPFLFVIGVKIGWHNACAATAASLGGAQAAAHTALLSVGMLCFVLGDVGSSLAQAFIPTFVSERNVSTGAKFEQQTHFDFEAAVPTIKQVLKCTLCISTTVVCLASIIIGRFGNCITQDPAVLTVMKNNLPWVATALSLHGSAVTLEGILLARKKLRGLTLFYSFLALTILGFQVVTRQMGLGLMGVWGCYCWVCGSRVIAFSALGGLLNPRKWWRRWNGRSRRPIQPPA